MPQQRARFIMLSMRGINRHVSRCSAYEFEDVIRSVEDVELIVPQLHDPPESRWLPLLNRGLRRLTRSELQRIGRVAMPSNPPRGDVLIVLCTSLADLQILRRWPKWRTLGQRALCWIDELWLARIDQYPQEITVLKEFDEIFVGFQRTAYEISRLFRRQCYALPQGVDMLRFQPPSPPPPRSIDVLSIGRRPEEFDLALRELSRDQQRYCLFDTAWLSDALDPVAHRLQLAQRIQRAKTFLVAPARITDRQQTHGQSELATRYFEGAAGGAILVGDRPQCNEFTECFPWPDAVIEWHPSQQGLEPLYQLLADEPRRRALSQQNVAESLRRHDWIYRWRAMLKVIQADDAPRVNERCERLAQRADAIDKSR